MHYAHPDLNPEIFGKFAPVEDFLKKIGAESAERVNKLTLKQGDFGEEMKVVVMEISG
jgi:hypothetical protein